MDPSHSSNRITIILTAVITAVVSVGLFIVFLVAFDWFYSEPVESASDTLQTEESTETSVSSSPAFDVIDKKDVLGEEDIVYIRDVVGPIASKQFDLDKITIHGVNDDNQTLIQLTVTSESLGKMVSRELATSTVNEDHQSVKEEMSKHIQRVSQLFSLELGQVVIEYTTPEMESMVFIRLYNQDISHDYFALTKSGEG